MARPYSVDLRERVVRAVEAGASRRATAAQYDVSPSFVIKLMQRWRRRGTVQPDRIGGSKRSTLGRPLSGCTGSWRTRRISRSPSCAPGWRPKASR